MRHPLALLLLTACTDLPERPAVVFNPDSSDFFATPWPSDLRRDPDGTVDMSNFPNPFDVPLLVDYIAHVDSYPGFGTNTPAYFSLTAPLDPRMLPGPQASLEDDSPVQLVNVDPRSPEFGQRVPVQWEVRQGEFSAYVPDHLLSVAPLYGYPLRPNTEYALLLTRDLVQRNPVFSAMWEPDHPQHALLANTLDALPFVGLGPQDIAIATVFTTQDPLAEMAAVTWHARESLGLPNLDLPLEKLYTHEAYVAYRTHYPSPVYTHGERPYDLEGGGFAFDDQGTPLVHSWDDMRLAVCVPKDLEAPPEGWPVVLYQHGTGGYYRGFCNSSNALEVAMQLGVSGIVGVGIDQPLHGPRGEGNDLTNFNLFNPASGVTNFRQGAVDAVYLAHALADRPWTFTTPDGVPVPTDPSRVLFMGHSQGGITGALAAPFFGDDIQAAMLSGAGGVLAITVVERKDIVDFEAVVSNMLRVENEPLSPLYPVLGLVQMAVEVTDPVNYAPYWFDRQGWWPHQRPTPVLLTSGTLDAATPYQTAIALAAAGQLPFLEPQITRSTAHDLLEIRGHSGPLQDNAVGWDGSSVTAAFSQWRDGSHWVVFEEPAAAEVYRGFLDTAARDAPVATPPL